MSSSRLVRGAKTRTFAFVCLICVLGAVLFVVHGTQVKLSDAQKQASLCNQQKESFHAQLQVIFEYKERLEKSLNKEKSDHKQTRESLEKQLKDETERIQRDLNAKNEVLNQQNNVLQGQLDELKEKYENLSREKERLDMALESSRKELEDYKSKKNDALDNIKVELTKKNELLKESQHQIDELKVKQSPLESERVSQLESEIDKLKEERRIMKNSLVACKEGRDKKTLLEPNAADDKGVSNDAAEVDIVNAQKVKPFSSTPGINPEALLGQSSAKPSVYNENSRKQYEQLGVVDSPKKPTQESIIPLIQPDKVDESMQGQEQIPVPLNHNPHSNILPKPNVEVPDNVDLHEENEENILIRQQQDKAQLQQPNAFVPDANRAEEEEEQINHFKAQGKGDNYHGGDYDKEQAEEEDEEGEQIDYDGDRSFKVGLKMKMQPPIRVVQAKKGGVMVNPK